MGEEEERGKEAARCRNLRKFHAGKDRQIIILKRNYQTFFHCNEVALVCMQMWELLTVVTITAVIRCRYIPGKLIIYLK